MIYAKEQPIGIDKQIYRFQQKISSIGWDNMAVYGKLYVTKRKNEKIAEAYIGNGEYKEVFIDDRHSAVFGFIPSDTRNGISFVNSDVKLICSVNLNKISNTSERKDEEAMLTVISVISPLLRSDNEKLILTGIEDVFSEISINRIKHLDMHPWFNFAFTFNIQYINDICDTLTHVATI